MAYSKSPAVARRELPYLNRLLAGGIVTWDNPDEGVEKFVYRLRQARNIIIRKPESFGKLASIIQSYRFEAGETQVRAVPTTISGRDIQQYIPAMQNMPRESVVVACVLDSPQSVEQFIQFFIDNQPTDRPFLMTNATFTNVELTQLESWAAMMEPELVIEQQEDQRILVRVKQSQG